MPGDGRIRDLVLGDPEAASYVADLGSLPPERWGSAGGKIAGLARLGRAGLPVPPGYCVTGDAFLAQVGDVTRSRDDLLHAISAEPFTSQVERAVRAASAGLEFPVAVRSSGADEDSAGASFAGQHETLLGVPDSDGVVAAVRQCWASFYSERAGAYRATMDATHVGSPPWVLVQRQVRADAAGVVFTIDPVDGSNRIVVNAVRGLGEALVSGRVEPDRFVIERPGGAVVESFSPCETPCLDRAALSVLRDAVLRAEEAFDAPLDVEFAFEDGVLWLLQARPVTAAGREWRSELDTEVPEGLDLYTRGNASEVLPDVLTPLSYSVLFDLGERGFQRAAIEVGAWKGPVDPTRPYFQGCFYGRAVLNFSTMLYCAARLPGMDPDALGENYFGKARDDAHRTPRDATLRRLSRAPKMLRVLVSIPRRARRAVRAVDAFLDAQPPLPSFASGALRAALADARRLAEEVLVVHLNASNLAGVSYEKLGTAIERWSGAPDPGLTARLVTGLSTLDSAKPTHELWDWSREVLAEPEQTALVRNTDAGRLLETLAEPSSEAARALRARLEGFLAVHGARGRDSGSAWSEDPRPVLDLLRAFLDLPADQSPAATAERQRRAREEATRALLARLTPARRVQLRQLVRANHRYLALRENLKGAMVRMTAHLRAIGLEAARRLAESGVLSSPDDGAFLFVDECVALVAPGATPDAGEIGRKIGRRRREYERNKSVDLPETFTGRPVPFRKEVVATADADQLTGLPVSPGTVSGPARVILDPATDGGIRPGEILVAPITDTGWTPLFAFAAGLVVDLGGQLSHGSIVAREFGLPAVVNVKEGTRVIRTGDRVTVDGDRGIVYVHRD